MTHILFLITLILGQPPKNHHESLQALRKHVEKRGKPGAGAVRDALRLTGVWNYSLVKVIKWQEFMGEFLICELLSWYFGVNG
jgi:hypothetical protein